jgi:ribosomal protein S18 acetylase RimI-like enzyme
MVTITRATQKDYDPIARIGKVSVGEAHKDAAPAEIMNPFLERNYNNDAIKEELSDANNIYYLINYKEQPVGFSKIVLNEGHPNIIAKNVTKLDRIYLLREYFGLKLGLQLLNFNIELAKNNNQSGIWLYTWTGNNRAISFYQRAGFTIIGSHKFYVSDTHYNMNHHMFLNLPN